MYVLNQSSFIFFSSYTIYKWEIKDTSFYLNVSVSKIFYLNACVCVDIEKIYFSIWKNRFWIFRRILFKLTLEFLHQSTFGNF